MTKYYPMCDKNIQLRRTLMLPLLTNVVKSKAAKSVRVDINTYVQNLSICNKFTNNNNL